MEFMVGLADFVHHFYHHAGHQSEYGTRRRCLYRFGDLGSVFLLHNPLSELV